MQTSVLRTLAPLIFSAALGPVSLMAQEPILVKVPFDFTAGSKSFAAGEYRVKEQAPHVLGIQSVDGHANLMTMTQAGQSNTKAGEVRLTFNRYGDRYFLAHVSGNDRGWELPKSSVEKELAARLALPEPKPVVLIAQ